MCSECTPRPEDFDACTRSLLNTLQFAGDAVDFRRFCLDQTDVAEFHQGSSKGFLHDLIHFLTLSVASASKNKRPLATSGLCSQKLKNPNFFFSSRRRHTRFDCDWSSDVCSSD